jgi:predicted RNase H-like HicB family nuclease
MKNFRFTAEITKDNEISQYIGIVPGLPPTLDELYHNLQEVVQLCLQEMTDEEIKDLPDFVGFQQISVAI